ncbi:MAG: ATP-binding cassette domain-containing protein, partial [Treponema sp.]|nr:ATP-binding cassette domain-containing protein [Treponema sp.]
MNNASEKSVLKIENLSVVFENKSLFKKKEVLPVLDDINLEVAPKEFVALVGESGCGKTMTTLSITNLLPENARITEGHILFSDGKNENSQDLTKLSKKEYKKVLGN